MAFVLAMPQLLTAQAERIQVLLETSRGNIIVELYNETPQHRDRFVANVRDGRYDGVQFHRVIRDFMVQTGHLGTVGLGRSEELPDDPDQHLIDPEIMVEKFIHERGALAAARLGDEVNPEFRSSGSQFYIVTGKYFTDLDLDETERKNGIHYTPAQRDAYKFRGGAPHLDGGYTIFGRVIDGYKAVDKIQHVDTDTDDRPVRPVSIKHARLLEGKARHSIK